MAGPSQVILLLEDAHHEQFIYRYLRKLGLGSHAMRIVKSPSGEGSAEQWVRNRFPIEVDAYRNRQAETKLIVLIDADAHSVQHRISQLDQALRDSGTLPVSGDERIARLVPKRNIETWILCLNNEQVNEEADYKTTHANWGDLIPMAASTLYDWTRRNAQLPPRCVDSLRMGISELKKIEV